MLTILSTQAVGDPDDVTIANTPDCQRDWDRVYRSQWDYYQLQGGTDNCGNDICQINCLEIRWLLNAADFQRLDRDRAVLVDWSNCNKN